MSTESVVTEYFDAFARRDIEAMVALTGDVRPRLEQAAAR